MKNIIRQLGEQLELNIDEKQIEKFLIYKDLLKEWNTKINLTAIIKDEEIVLKHFIDSLTIEKYIERDVNLIDIGTGAGFPGLPLKIIRDDLKVTLLDSLNKRLVFLNEVKNKLNLRNVDIIHGRAEDIARDMKYREKYTIATARAVANLATLSEYCLPFVKINGYFICMKGNNLDEIEEAKKAIEILGGEIIKVENRMLPGSDIERNIIVIQKIKSTPEQYPRKAGIPSKNPIR